jgi:predicted GNAT family N-acyltransferase
MTSPPPDSALTILPVVVDSPEHAAQLALRGRVLRTPLGLDPATARHPAEAQATHWCAYSAQGALVGCVSLLPLEWGEVKLFQMAVEPQWQGRGVGRALVLAFEDHAAAILTSRVVLHARCEAQGFYARLGYLPEGDVFEEVSIPHILMVKDLPM